MPVLKFWERDGTIVLDQLRLEDITADKRTALVNRESFIRDEFQVADKVYMAISDIFFKMSKIFNKQKAPISAMLIKDRESTIVIVPSRSYVFWNGKSVEPIEYRILSQETSVYKKLISM
jgi:hypothetical protein